MADKVSMSTAKASGSVNHSLLASPARTSAARETKERRNPSITPRKFKKFFSPRNRVSATPSAARQALRELASPVINQCQTPANSSPLRPISEEYLEEKESSSQSERVWKRQKTWHMAEASLHLCSPSRSSPSRPSSPESHMPLGSPIRPRAPSRLLRNAFALDGLDVGNDLDISLPCKEKCGPARKILPFDRRGYEAQLLQRMTGTVSRPGRQIMRFPVADPVSETANFCSRPGDSHFCSSHEGEPRSLPFCAATCNNNSLVAVGDDEGYVRLLDSQGEFSKLHLAFQAHSNAAIDLEFSTDDYFLATASGDQKGKVYDMMTQTPVAILSSHTASLKQIRFQPGRGANSVLATSSRDGSVRIWDLRCRGGPVQQVPIIRQASLTYAAPDAARPGCVINTFHDAHARTQRFTGKSSASSLPGSCDTPRVAEGPGRFGDVSVTALQFLPAGREHLFLTACDADAVIKLWDIRNIRSSSASSSRGFHKNGGGAHPLSCTVAPESHVSWRPFGISSLALGTDAARLYAVCKDHTVYAYSTAHLVLGNGGDLAAGPEPPRRKPGGPIQEGLGPLYGFRHHMFHASSFFIKAAVRPSRNGRSELLAVGSSDRCALLFPTDERHLRVEWERQAREVPKVDQSTVRPGLCRKDSAVSLGSGRLVDRIPVATHGTPLVRGHGEEVGTVTWTHSGRLISVADDCVVRCWHEDRSEASDLRTGGETEGRRWGCGWAEICGDNAWDEDNW